MKLSLSVEVLGQSSLPLFYFQFHMLIPPADGNLTSFASHGQPFNDCFIHVVKNFISTGKIKVVVFPGRDQVPNNLL